VIGTGGFSVVTLTADPVANKRIAVKHISVEQYSLCLMREVEALAKLNHPCVIRIFGWASAHGQTPAEIHMEYAENNSIKEVLEKVNCGLVPAFWNPTGIGIIIGGLVLGMRFVHSRGIVHRDLKPANILLGPKGRVLIADFGTSQSVYEVRMPGEATAYYSAPELFQGGVTCDPKSDVFSFGLVLYEILAGKPVFDSQRDTPLGVLRRLRDHDLPDIPDGWGEFIAKLIPRCWNDDPANRPSFQEISDLFWRSNFTIIPNGNCARIHEYCESIGRWESENPTST
jgi:serine/threonine-protein kinase